ncbi:hypothetical protein, partial [Rathayibacter sp. VKM Ac-2630]|uniref:hypothetical protein n=1 Tax=Rathayibacter sp. VKM Ac-2630 TaxID=1938617 RepID=UPI0009D3F6D4
DYTTATNATVLAEINAALGAAATADSYDVVKGEHYPDFAARQRTHSNTGTAGIEQWSAVKLAANNAGVQRLETTDPATAFYGIAVEPIAPGQIGRILRKGRLSAPGQLLGWTGAAVAPGATVYHSDTTPGALATTGTRPALTGYLAGWATL